MVAVNGKGEAIYREIKLAVVRLGKYVLYRPYGVGRHQARHASLVAPARDDAPREQRQYQHAALRVKHVAVEEAKEAEVEPCLQLGVVHLQQPA